MPSSLYPSRLAKNEIRVLTLPASSSCDATLEYYLETITQSSNRPYVALSYVWGCPTPDKTVVVNGQQTQITSSLFEALRYLQQPDSVITLWADAICINQADNDEKGEQVQQMKSIYERASFVHVWMGPAADGSDELMATMSSLGERALKAGIVEETFAMIPETNGNQQMDCDSGTISVLALIEEVEFSFPYPAYKAFFQRPWWFRIWVVQEISVGREAIFACGEKRVPYYSLMACYYFEFKLRKSLLSQIMKKYTNIEEQTKALMDFTGNCSDDWAEFMIGTRLDYQSRLRRPETRELVNLLARLNAGYPKIKLAATDNRDRVFALLGIADDSLKLGITPDYSKTCQTVYTQTARELCLHGHIEILAFSQFPKFESKPPLPSWVPDWRGHIDSHVIGALRTTGTYRAGLDRASSVTATEDLNIIMLGATFVDSVKQTGTALRWETGGTFDFDSIVKYLTEVLWFLFQETKSMDGRKVFPDPNQCQEAVWRIPIEDLQPTSSFPRRAQDQMKQGYNALLGSFHFVKNRPYVFAMLEKLGIPDPCCSIDLEDSADFEEAIQTKTRRDMNTEALKQYFAALKSAVGRLPFITSRGYVGIAPANTKIGDKIYIVFGSAVPYIFRQTSSGKHQLVGSVYVHSIMDGEFLEEEYMDENLCII